MSSRGEAHDLLGRRAAMEHGTNPVSRASQEMHGRISRDLMEDA